MGVEWSSASTSEFTSTRQWPGRARAWPGRLLVRRAVGRSVVLKRRALLEYQGALTVVVRVPVVECAGPSPTRLVVY